MVLRVNITQTAADVAKAAPDLSAIEAQYGLPSGVLAATSHVESGDNPNTRPSSAGAIGQFQIMPAVARNLGVDPSDPMQAAHGAAQLWRQNLDASNGDVSRAAMMYHGGPNTAIWGPKTHAYAGKIAAAMPGDPSDPFEAAFAGKAAAAAPRAPAPAVDATDPFEVAFAGGTGTSAPQTPNGNLGSGVAPARPGGVAPSANGQLGANPGGTSGVGGGAPSGQPVGSGTLDPNGNPANGNGRAVGAAVPNAATSPTGYLASLLRSGSDLATGTARGYVNGVGGGAAELIGRGTDYFGLTHGQGDAVAADRKRVNADFDKREYTPGGAADTVGNISGNIIGTLPLGAVGLLGKIPRIAEAGNAVTQAALTGTKASQYARLLNAGGRIGDAALGGAAGNLVASDPGSDPGQNAGMGAAIGAGVGMVSPLAGRIISPILDRTKALAGLVRGSSQVAEDVAPQVAPSAQDIAGALRNSGQTRSIGSTTKIPDSVLNHVTQLRQQGVPLDQAIREAETHYVGASPTAANVSRDFGESQATAEGAKAATPEGRALQEQMVANNAALHNETQRTIANYGGAPAKGEAVAATQQALADASDAAKKKVSALYTAAQAEHGHVPTTPSEPNLSAPQFNDGTPRAAFESPDEYQALTPRASRSANGALINRRGPMDLVTALRSMGGLKEYSGELRSAGITNAPRRMDFARNEGFYGPLVNGKKAMNLDDAALHSWQEGYFPDHVERPTINEFLDAVKSTHSGGDRVWHPDDWEELHNFHALQGERFHVEQMNDAVHAEPIPAGEERTKLSPPLESYAADLNRNGGAVGVKSLYDVLKTPEFKGAATPEGRAFGPGMKRALDALSSNGREGLNPHDLERVRKIAGSAYNPMGGGANHLSGQFKGEIDKLFDELGDASPAFKAARALHRDWAQQYDVPGVADLIKRDASGAFVKSAIQLDRSLIGGMDERPFGNMVDRLNETGNTDALNKLKASAVQDAYEAATRNAGDASNNGHFSGKLFHDALDKIGMAKLSKLFTPDEIGHLATIGRAARTLNESVPGSVNTSNTSSALGNMLRESVGTQPQSLTGKLVVGGLKIGATATGAVFGGPVGAVAGHAVGEAAGHLGGAARTKALAAALRAASSPSAARATEAAAAAQNAARARQIGLARMISQHGAPALAAAHGGQR